MPAGISSATFTPDNLLLEGPVLTRKVTLLSGQDQVRGALLGKITLGTATSAAKSGGNTGGGTCTMDVTTPVLANCQVGVYTVRCHTVESNGGKFWVKDPTGKLIGQTSILIDGGAFACEVKFVLADSGTDFAVGDGFDITVAAGSGKYVLSLSASLNGSQVPCAILAEDTDASGGDVDTPAYHAGTFNHNAITFGTGHTAASVRDGLQDKGIYLPHVLVTY